MSIDCAFFGFLAAAALKKQDRVYIEGTVRLDWLSKDGNERHGLNVAASRCEATHRIGRNKPERQQKRSRTQPSASAGSPSMTRSAFEGA